MRLIIAEKPSVGKSIAAVVGATERKDGYLEGGGSLVSWCAGHLLELATTNAEARKNTPADNLKLYQMLTMVYDALKHQGYRGLGRRRDFIAEKLGVANGYIGTLEEIDKGLNPEFKEKFAADHLSYKAAEISRLSEADQAALLQATDDGMGEDLEPAAESVEAPDMETIEADLSTTAELFAQATLRPRQIDRVNKSKLIIMKQLGIIRGILEKGSK